MAMNKGSHSYPLLVALLLAGFGAGRLNPSPIPGRTGDAPTTQEVEQAHASARELSLAFREVSRSAGRSVISVRAEVKTRRGRYRRLAQGSGVIVREDGMAVTNNHVIQGAERVVVFLWDGSERSASILGRDAEADIALLQLDGSDFDALPFADPEGVDVGEWVLALGNPLGLGPTVTAGIVSGTGRADIGIATYEDFIQTDAAINPGNSGGALVDLEGRLLGINTAMGTGAGGNLGIGFAIPGPMVRTIVAELAEAGRVRRGWLGIQMDDLPDEMASTIGFVGESRVAVRTVIEGSPASQAGIAQGDLVLAIEGRAVATTRELLNAIADIEPGTEVTIDLWRAGSALRLPVRIAERSPEVLATPLGE